MPELADILRLHGPAYLAKYHARLLPSHRRAIQDIAACRTAALGGHLYRCPQCHQDHYQYHSCQNRHCPQCQHEQVDRWLEQQRALLLPVVYFLATFTLPRGLRSLARSHQKVVYALFFRASQRALQTLAADPRYVGGTLGLMGVLQTWTRDLRYHPHVHYLIPGVGWPPTTTPGARPDPTTSSRRNPSPSSSGPRSGTSSRRLACSPRSLRRSGTRPGSWTSSRWVAARPP